MRERKLSSWWKCWFEISRWIWRGVTEVWINLIYVLALFWKCNQATIPKVELMIGRGGYDAVYNGLLTDNSTAD